MNIWPIKVPHIEAKTEAFKRGIGYVDMILFVKYHSVNVVKQQLVQVEIPMYIFGKVNSLVWKINSINSKIFILHLKKVPMVSVYSIIVTLGQWGKASVFI